jgi:transposase-like protein
VSATSAAHLLVTGDALPHTESKPIYTAPSAEAALIALDELEEKWGSKYAAMIRL